MTRSVFDSEMRKLKSLFSNSCPAQEGMKIYWEKLNHYSDEAFTNAVEHLITHGDDRGRYPTISALTALSEMFEDRQRESEHSRVKAEERKTASKFFSGELSKDVYAKQCMALIVGHMTGKTTRGQYMEGMEDLGITNSSMKRWYAYHSLPLDKQPLSQYGRRIND